MRWDSGFNCRAASQDEQMALARARGTTLPHDPLEGLPQRIMRVDGAMEAWLEELPLPQDMRCEPIQYQSLNDAAARPELSLLRAGNRQATIWYFRVEFLQQLWPQFMRGGSDEAAGLKLWQDTVLPHANIESTHMVL